MKKTGILRFLALLLAAMLLVGMIPQTAFAEPAEESATETESEAAEAVEAEAAEDVEVPSAEGTEADAEAAAETEEEALPEGEAAESPSEEEIAPPEEPAADEEFPAEDEALTEDPEEDEDVLNGSEEEAPILLETGEEVSITMLGDGDSPAGITVSVDKAKTRVVVNKVGSSGAARLVRLEANEYLKGDKYHGLSAKTAVEGTDIGTYTCGAAQSFEFNRYRNDGTDNLYSKFYVVQNDTILAGPVYATEISSMRNIPAFEVNTKKGLTHEDSTTPGVADEMHASNTVINFDLGSLIYRNEDDNGNPIDNSNLKNIITFESNGETFYFDAGFVKNIDADVSAYSRRGINVSLVIIAWYNTDFKRYPSSLAYTKDNRWTMAFNTSNDKGLKYWIAAMEFVADRYSKTSSIGLVDKFIIGNEIDYTYDWSRILDPYTDADKKHYNWADLDTFMEEYARGFRMANLAVKKYNAGAKVTISFTHNWADSRRTAFINPIKDTSLAWNSYAPKDMLDWMNTVEKSRGDYDWSISVHPYPLGTTSSNPYATDVNSESMGLKPVTGDWKTSPWITCVNLELYQQYLERPEATYNGQVREVSLTETSICNPNKKDVSTEEYQTAIYQQAASIAQYYYRSACIPCISEIAYFEVHDQTAGGAYQLGLCEVDGTKKPSYDVWKYVDTNLTYTYANKYLKYINSSASSYYDLMDLTKSGYDWPKMWSDESIIRRTVSDADAERSIKTNKTSYVADEPIIVTATGGEGDQIGLYKQSDNVYAADPIYSYALNTTVNGVKIASGKDYSMLAYGSISAARVDDAALKAGAYKVVLRRGDTGECITADITLTGDYSIGTTAANLVTDKTEYKVGENIIVTASAPGSDAWVGIYKSTDKCGSVTSIYWYWVNDSAKGIIPGKPVIMQTTTHNTDSSNPSAKIASGTYIVYLFGDSGYSQILKKVEITISGSDEVQPLTSVDYKLSNDTDGFANGVVTVRKDADNDSATDCVMYWADKNGTPLEGYTALAKFKLTGEVTQHEMYTHTMIPEGAEMLLAYAFDGDVLSSTAVSCSLPAGCAYKIEGTKQAEFQIISDVHVTTDSGATGEVTKSNEHFAMMLEDVKTNSTDSLGIFINGDIANTGSEAEFKKVYSLYQASLNAGGTLPYIHMAIGNHDYYNTGNPNKQFQKYAKILNPTLKKTPDNVYYDEVVGGYHFIYLGSDEYPIQNVIAVLSKEQLTWLDDLLAKCTAEDPNKPIFMFLHQSFYNTVAGSMPGQGWDGISDEAALKNVLKKYGQIILVNGHSHWTLNSERCLFTGDEDKPVALNTAAVSYLWTSYDITAGEFEAGSQGYFVQVYDDKVLFRGRDFESGKWIPSAQFVLQKNEVQAQDTYDISIGSDAINLDADGASGGYAHFISLTPSIASVTSDGTVIPKQKGTAEIVATYLGTDTTTMSRKRVTVNITDVNVERFAGDDRFETSLKTAEALKKKMGVDKFENIVLTSGRNFADALAGSYLAHVKNAPILITADKFGSTVPYQKMNAYIKKNLADGGTVYILGSEAAVSTKAIADLKSLKVKRLGGADRYETNIAILKEAGVKAGDDILVATGKNFADSLSASAVTKPIILVSSSLKDAQKTYLNTLKGSHFYILGGTPAVSTNVRKEIAEYGATERIAGENRYETSVLIAEKFFENPTSAVLAYSLNFPDGLCGGPLAMAMGAPLILTKTVSEAKAIEYCKNKNISAGAVLGSPSLISSGSVAQIFRYDPNVLV